MAQQVQVPSLGESVTQAILVRWHKADGESVAMDEALCELETDKANVDVPAPAGGVVHRVKEEGATVSVGEVIARIDEGAAKPESKTTIKSQTTKAEATKEPEAVETPTATDTAPEQKTNQLQGGASVEDRHGPAVRRLLEENKLDAGQIQGSGPEGRLTKEDVLKFIEARRANGQAGLTAASDVSADRGKNDADEPVVESESAAPRAVKSKPAHSGQSAPAAASGSAPPKPMAIDFDASGVRRVPMSKIRRRIADTLVHAQQTAAILTTFNEVDMSAIMSLRVKYKEQFEKTHNVGLGFMSFFAKAVVLGLKEFPRANAYIDGDDIVYHNYVHLGIAVSTDRGLAVPVLRHVENMSFARIEAEIKRLATSVREGRLSLEELSGGTFTVTNGGVFGSLLSTPIINPPQSAILGMHAIQKRPVVIDDKVEIRPMMYVALSYDHRLVDGRESVSLLVRIKQLIEDPSRLMLEV